MVIEGGVQSVTDALIDRLKGRAEIVKEKVERIERSPTSGYRLVCADGSVVEADASVVTPAGKALARVIRGLDSALAETLDRQEYASLGVVHLSVPRSEPLIKDAFGVLFQAGMPDDLLGVMFNSQIFPHVAPPDRHILTVMVGGAQARSKDFDEEGLKERLPGQLAKLLEITTPEWLCLTKWVDAIPQLKVGHHKVVERLDAFEAAHSGLVITGVDRGGVGVTERVRLAQEGVKRARLRGNEYRSVA